MTRPRAAALALAAPLLLTTACTPGWDGTGTIVELELTDYENHGNRLTDPGPLEVTVLTERGTEVSVAVGPHCVRDLELGAQVTATSLADGCGELGASHDD